MSQPAAPGLWQRVLQAWSSLSLFGFVLASFYIWSQRGFRSTSRLLSVAPAAIIVAAAATFILAFGWVALSRADDARISRAAQNQDPARILSMIQGGSLLPAQRDQYLRQIVAMGPAAVPLLIRCLNPYETFPEMTNALAKRLGKVVESNAALRSAAAYCLGEMREASAVPHLSKALKDSDASVRAASEAALRKIGSEASAPPAHHDPQLSQS